MGHYLVTLLNFGEMFNALLFYYGFDLQKGQEFLCQVALECAMPQATADMEGKRSSVEPLGRYQ